MWLTKAPAVPILAIESVIRGFNLGPFCWCQNQIAATMWSEVDDLKVFKVLDLEDFQKTFSAYQKPQVTSLNHCSYLTVSSRTRVFRRAPLVFQIETLLKAGFNAVKSLKPCIFLMIQYKQQ